jgi:hypothetical protein
MRTIGFLFIGMLSAGCGASDVAIVGDARSGDARPGEDGPGEDGPIQAAAPQDSTQGGAAPTAPMDLTPAYWNVDALADSPSPGSEPLNVVITTNISMAVIVDALPRTRNPEQGAATWKRVAVGESFGACMSEERGTIDGAPTTTGRDPQTLSLRLGVVVGCDGVLFDGESHARGWKSETRSTGRDASGRTIETWYFAVSQEHVCFVDVNGVPTPWHCILPQNFRGDLLGINGSVFTAETGGYNQGRDHFVANLKRLGEPGSGGGWAVECNSIERANGGGGGAGQGLLVSVHPLYALTHPGAVEPDPRDPSRHILKRVTWDSRATHCSIMQ